MNKYRLKVDFLGYKKGYEFEADGTDGCWSYWLDSILGGGREIVVASKAALEIMLHCGMLEKVVKEELCPIS